MKRLVVVTLGVVAAVFFAGNAFAQSCSTSDKADLRECVTQGVNACADAASSCNPLDLVLTLDDVEDIAREKCCSKNSKKARRLCLATEKLRYKSELSGGAQQAFYRAARNEIKALQTGDCADDGAYASLF